MRHVTALIVLLLACGSSSLLAQGFDWTVLVTLQDPSLAVTFAPLQMGNQFCGAGSISGPGGCNNSINLTCIGGLNGQIELAGQCMPIFPASVPRQIGTDSAGRGYGVTGISWSGVPVAGGTFYQGTALISRDDGTGPTQSIATVNVIKCTDPTCTSWYRFGVTVPSVDPVEGIISMVANGEFYSSSGSSTGNYARVTISGLPKLFDTLLTFLPSGQTLTALTPGLPDGFRSADSLQVWSGDVRTLPDWSQATPLVCSAAVSPSRGQLVSFNDPLPDPPIGQARYYLTATQNGTQRRLGRQFVDGVFSARNPTILPICQ